MTENKELALFNHVDIMLTSLSYKYTKEPAKHTFRLNFSGSVFSYDSFLVCGENYLTINVRLPFNIKEQHFSAILNLANDVNAETPVGNLELLKEVHSLTSRNGIHIETFPTAEQIKSMISRATVLAEMNATKVSEILLNNPSK